MPLTPDRFPGEEDCEGLVFEEKAADPTLAGGLRYVGGRFRFKDSSDTFGLLFGRNPQDAESEDSSSTSETTYQDKLSLVVPALAGRFRLGFSANISADAGNKRVWVRVFNSTDAVVLQESSAYPPIGNLQIAVSGFKYVTLAGVSKTFKIQWRREAGSPSFGATIRNARLELWRVS